MQPGASQDAAVPVSGPVDVLPGRWERSRPWLRAQGWVMTLLCALALAGFALPWVGVSCGGARTEELSGFELAFAMDPGITTTAREPDPVDIAEVEKMVNGLRDIAAVMFLFTVGSLVCGVLVALSPKKGEGRITLLLAALAAHGYVAFLTATEEYWGADAERHSGLYFAALFASLAAIWAISIAASTRSEAALRHGGVARAALIAVCLLVPLLLLGAAGGEAGLRFALAAGLIVCVTVWAISAWLTLAEPSWMSGVALLLSGGPIALVTGGA